ncbi:MAG: DUF262 domain-containing protein, partial [Planctomycetota bacterium]
VLSPMEIRKSIYHGDFYELLERLNGLESWRLLLGQSKKQKRLRDVEFVLRTLAMRYSLSEYEKPMKGFLNNFMAVQQAESNATKGDSLNKLGVFFTKAVDEVVDKLGEKPFHLRGRLNVAAMDSILPLAHRFSGATKDTISKRYQALKNDAGFINDTSYNTSDASVVKKRFKTAKEFLLG